MPSVLEALGVSCHYFHRRVKSFHTDLGRRKSSDCTSRISIDFGVKWDKFFQ